MALTKFILKMMKFQRRKLINGEKKGRRGRTGGRADGRTGGNFMDDYPNQNRQQFQHFSILLLINSIQLLAAIFGSGRICFFSNKVHCMKNSISFLRIDLNLCVTATLHRRITK